MLRTFETNYLREVTELSSSLWEFSPNEGEFQGNVYPVWVPCCWENLPDFSAYRGTGSFRKEFEAEGNVRLVFKGVSHTATVLVDGKEVGSHYNAYTPFSVMLKDLEPGVHKLEVIADNRFSEKSALHVPNDYMSYGGISRGVAMEELEGAYIEYIHAVPERTEKGWNVKLAVDAGTPEVWEMDHPVLYTICAVLSDADGAFDDLADRIGFREIKTVGKDILLNGKKLRIKGFCRHEDHPMYGCALPVSAIEQDLQIAKDLDEIFLDLCDEQGILVWEENHARGLVLEQMQNPNFEPQAEACIQEMITAHINHPCIIIWGILNECASDTEYGYECYKKQYHDTPANEYVPDIYNWVQTGSEGAGKPFLVTEIGAGAIYGYRNQSMCKWTEEYQAKALGDQITAVLDQEGCSGIYIWQFCDVRISNEWFSNRPRTMNNKGIVDEYRRRKLSYDVVKKLYHSYSDFR